MGINIHALRKELTFTDIQNEYEPKFGSEDSEREWSCGQKQEWLESCELKFRTCKESECVGISQKGISVIAFILQLEWCSFKYLNSL